jgi:hypothetical protein
MGTLWQLADGKKTTTGAALQALAMFGQLVGVISPEQFNLISQLIAPLLVVGVGHKAVKVVQG